MEIFKSRFINDDIIYGRLLNGLQYYIIKREKYLSKLGLLCVNFGSVDNKFSVNGKVHYVKDGTAHLLEHLVFEHKHYNVLDRFSKLNADVNAYTNFNSTAYYFNTINNYYYCLNSLVDFVFSNYIKEESLKLEKNIINNEISMFRENPQYRAFFNMLTRLLKKSSLNISIVGSHQSVSSITINDLENIFNTFYTPNNMAFIGIGDIDENQVVKALGNIKKKNTSEIKKYYFNDTESISDCIIYDSMNVSKQFFCFGLKIFYKKSIDLKSEIAFSILIDLIFGESSHFYELCSLKGLVDNDFFGDFIVNKELGVLTLQGSSNNAEQLLEEILEKMNNLNVDLNEEKFNIIKRKKIGRLIQNFNSIDFVASFQVDLFNKGFKFHDYFTFLNEIDYNFFIETSKSIKIDNNYVLSIINNKF